MPWVHGCTGTAIYKDVMYAYRDVGKGGFVWMR